jgi:SP family myo-inositol transporter-like MFS transporter 13
MSTPNTPDASAIKRYTLLLLAISGMGGLLYGIDIGIISPALPYLEKTINLTEQQLSYIVAAVLAGSAISSVVAGALADFIGRKKMMIISALLFVLSVGIIYVSKAFVPLLVGRLLQGASGGFIAVVVPLYLAECLPSASRGKGTGLFQLFLTIGIAAAALVGTFYVNQADTAIAAAKAAGDAVAELEAANHAWRSMFLFVMWPGLVFLVGTFVLAESPRWLFGKGKTDAAKVALLKSRTEAEAELELKEMAEHSDKASAKTDTGASAHGSILQRKYVIPFVLACIILGCNQATGINSILGFMGIIFQKAGLDSSFAANMDFGVKLLNVFATLIGVALVDRMGRKFLLKTGTAIIITALCIGAGVFYSFESKRIDVADKVTLAIKDNAIVFPVNAEKLGASATDGSPMELSILYAQGDKEAVTSVFTNDKSPVLKIDAAKDDKGAVQTLTIKRAKYGPVPTKQTGYAVVGALMLFIIGFAMGPGVCVWLALSELMPTRIRSMGMGIALVINQAVATGIAAFFLPIVGNFGYGAMFLFWAACTVVYFVTAAFFLPETKGKTLEEIEEHFEGKKKHA